MVVVDDLGELRTQLYQLALVELAAKYGELQVFPESEHDFVDAAQALGIADVVGDDVRLAHEITESRMPDSW